MSPDLNAAREALDRWDEEPQTTVTDDDVLTIFDVARWALDLFTVCENCGGFGYKNFRPDVVDYSDVVAPDPCPACGGSGHVLNPERLADAKASTSTARQIRAYLGEG